MSTQVQIIATRGHSYLQAVLLGNGWVSRCRQQVV